MVSSRKSVRTLDATGELLHERHSRPGRRHAASLDTNSRALSGAKPCAQLHRDRGDTFAASCPVDVILDSDPFRLLGGVAFAGASSQRISGAPVHDPARLRTWL